MISISFNDIVPFALKDSINTKSQIWDNKVTFNKGELYLIKAISGSGKSTFVHLIYGLRKDYQGIISYDNKPIYSFHSNQFSPIRKNELSIVFQDLKLFDQLTVEENILIKTPELKQLNSTQLEWLNRLNIAQLKDKNCGFLSYGERQRVAIIRALSQNYDFLLLDEPFSHLDKENGKQAYELILETSKDKGIIMTSLGNEDFINTPKTLFL